jgi:hypothetical protein
MLVGEALTGRHDLSALEQQLIEAYYAAPGHSAVLTVGGRLYLVSDATSFNNKTSTALVWAELSTAALTRLCSQYAENGQTTAIYCTDGSNIFTVRSPGSASAPAALVVDIQDAVLNEFTGSTETKVDAAEYLRIVQPVGSWSLWTANYAGTDALRDKLKESCGVRSCGMGRASFEQNSCVFTIIDDFTHFAT